MTDFSDSLARLPASLRPAVLAAHADLCQRSPEPNWDSLPAAVRDSAAGVWAASPFVAGQCARRPELLFDLSSADHGVPRLLRPTPPEEYRSLLADSMAGISDDAGLMSALRRFRNREMVRIAWRDSAGWATLDETLMDVSLLAETCVQLALERLFQNACMQRGTPLNQEGEAQNLVVLGMGKLGAWELNFSSDIDLIFAYRDDGTLADKRETSYSEFYSRLARNLVKLLDAITEDGFVFRVDTRLRPFGDSGPLVMSFDAMESYYQSQAREWERYAMVKVRTIAGDMAAGAALENFLRPFVYRRYLDYRALGELRELKRKISQELQRKDRQGNVKLGPGGIREIEFIGQAFQLIRGGQEKALRERRIQRVLAVLPERSLMAPDAVNTLLSAYRYLRTVENRLQQYADRQTHDLPVNPLERLAIAHVLGYSDWDSFTLELDQTRTGVHAIFLEVITGGDSDQESRFVLNGEVEQSLAALHQLGWPQAESHQALTLLQPFQTSHPIRNLTSRGAAELQRLLPKLLRAIASTVSPAVTLERILGLLEAIASRNVYLTLLAENPPARTQLVTLAAASPWICHSIARHPLLLDDLLDPRSLYTPLTPTELRRELNQRLEAVEGDDLEQRMIVLCQFKQANVLRVAAADLSGAIPVMVVSDYLTWIAEGVVAEALHTAWHITAQRHGVPQGCREERPDGFAVIAYGKLGGLELGYGSDLDLVFLYEGDGSAPTRGDKPVTTAEFFGRVGKRIVHILTTNTPSGTLYETDLRLRPSGGSGLLVSSIDAYETYQMDSAWTWEQQALVKARFVAGDSRVGARFEAIRRASLCRPRDRSPLRDEVVEMREKMRTHLGSKDRAVFNIKHDFGGIVDIEFLVQFGVLSGAQASERLVEWTDVVRILDALTAAGFIDSATTGFLKEAYCLYREQAHRAALQEMPALLDSGRYGDMRHRVQRIWQDVMLR